MLPIRSYLGPILALIIAFPLSAQTVPADSVLALGVQWKLPARTLPEERTVWVHFPPGYDSARSHEVLYVLDAHGLFPIASGISDYLSLMGRISPTIVVGVTSLSPADRARNFTPIVDESRRERFPSAGQADRFLRFLETELIPAVERRYRTSARRTLAGHSLAGLFVLHALVSRPELFDGYVAISPTLSWAGGHTLQQLQEFFDGAPAGRFLFASVGNEPGAYTESLNRLESILQGAPTAWKWRVDRFLMEDHVTTVAPALHSALRAAHDSTVSH